MIQTNYFYNRNFNSTPSDFMFGGFIDNTDTLVLWQCSNIWNKVCLTETHNSNLQRPKTDRCWKKLTKPTWNLCNILSLLFTWYYVFNIEFINWVFITSLANSLSPTATQKDTPSSRKHFNTTFYIFTGAMWIASTVYADPLEIVVLLRHSAVTKQTSLNVSVQAWSESTTVSFPYMIWKNN